jgi:hypothetical protein
MISSLPPQAVIAIPPAVQPDARALQAQAPAVHPAWQRVEQRGRHFVLRTTSLDDLSELADWAKVSLIEPERPLEKAQRAGFKIVLERVERWACLEDLGACHCLAVSWKDKDKSHKQH